MKLYYFAAVFAATVSLVSCKKEITEEKKTVITENKPTEPEVFKEYYGIYTGDFSGKSNLYDKESKQYYESEDFKKLALKINRITKDSVYGTSIVDGKQRPFRGVFNEADKSFVLDEPGNDKYDGRFSIKLNKDSITGTWAAYDKKAVQAPLKNMKLVKKQFVYNPNLMLDPNIELIDWQNPKDIPEKYTDPETGKTETFVESQNRTATSAAGKINASKQKLAEKDLKNLRKFDLEILKNTVYARHGYAFKNGTFRNIFEQSEWYVPVSDDVDGELTPLEKENIALLSRMAKYAQDKYETFGR
ncbi:serine/threonine protein kinase [Chryseobacterium sp. Leaf180]|uniref:YARHG domain-containing protein n=1 Tax=Chryseobacterium sp. Leaf180 TaxID=1736289 RepID=UPI0006F54636|nr:YARHG domain-containing protein [Chryseobacterium sp. Leaf180]KQR95292.1 serine/threonine protein kinase [Chryseobacterium sp. Leaf180]